MNERIWLTEVLKGGSLPVWLRLNKRYGPNDGSDGEGASVEEFEKMRMQALASREQARIVLTVKDAALDSGTVDIDGNESAMSNDSDDDDLFGKRQRHQTFKKIIMLRV